MANLTANLPLPYPTKDLAEWEERGVHGGEEEARPIRQHPCKNVVLEAFLSSFTITSTTSFKMKRISQLSLLDGMNALRSCTRTRVCAPFAQRCLHTSPPNPATVAPITASGPPPTAPVPSAEHVDSRVARRRKQAELLQKGQDLRAVAAGTGGGSAKHKRFWKDVHVKHTDGKNFAPGPNSLSISSLGSLLII